jgi:hypothetical protein
VSYSVLLENEAGTPSGPVVSFKEVKQRLDSDDDLFNVETQPIYVGCLDNLGQRLEENIKLVGNTTGKFYDIEFDVYFREDSKDALQAGKDALDARKIEAYPPEIYDHEFEDAVKRLEGSIQLSVRQVNPYVNGYVELGFVERNIRTNFGLYVKNEDKTPTVKTNCLKDFRTFVRNVKNDLETTTGARLKRNLVLD